MHFVFTIILSAFLRVNSLVVSFIHFLYGFREEVPNDINWHTKLLEKAFSKTKTGESILSNEYKETLNRYMRFRHLFRHTYNYKIEIDKLKPLVDGSPEIWEKVKNDVVTFIKKK